MHYFTQRFRTRALGRFMIWGGDWANLSSTCQGASCNVELMRAAARRRGQTIGHYLISYAGRKPWDVKLKATSELGRGVKILGSFYYGPSWAGHLERHVAEGSLDGYAVCYLSWPNLAREAAENLKAWVRRGGTLWLTAGAAARDEYNRPLRALDDILLAARGEAKELQPYKGAGRHLSTLAPRDEVRWEGGAAEALSVKQILAPLAGAKVLATFKDGSPALVKSGTVYAAGFLPALAYIIPALEARAAGPQDSEPAGASRNFRFPWRTTISSRYKSAEPHWPRHQLRPRLGWRRSALQGERALRGYASRRSGSG